MSQVSKRKVDKELKIQLQDSLVYVIKDLKVKNDAEEFISSVFSEVERLMIAKRVLAAFLLSHGIQDSQISEILKLTPGTISRLKMQIKLHPRGYELMFRKLNRKSNQDLAKQVFYKFLNYAIKSASGRIPNPF